MTGLREGIGRTIHNGIDSDGIAARAAQPLAEAHLRWFDGPSLVAVGRLDHQKGFDLLLRALRRLRDLGHQPRLVLLGTGPEADRLSALAQSLGLADQVLFAGFQANPHAYMAKATLLVAPSRFEGFGLVIAEALAAGTPVVASDCRSGPREILADGQCGRLVPVEDVESLARAVAALLEDPAARQALAKAGRSRARAFDTAHFVTQWQQVVCEAASPVRRPRQQRSLPPEDP